MSGASRPTRPCDRPLVLTSEESGGGSADSINLSAPGAYGSRGALSPAADSRGGLHMRPPSPRRSSSGYFSNENDSLPASPLFQRPQTADKATQTVSLSAQSIEHAVSRLADDHSESAHHRQHGRRACSTHPANAMRDMPAVQVGRELREYGDEFNRILTRRAAGAPPQWRPVVPREPAVLICVGLLIYFFGRLLYTHGTAYSQSQV